MSYYITGCDSGFGRDLVKKLYLKGHQVFAGCLLDKTVIELKEEFPGVQTGSVVPLILDVTDEDSVLKAAASIRKITSKLDGLVNNAGILLDGVPAEWASTHAFRKTLEVNVIGMASVTRSVLNLIRPAEGRIVNVASLVGFFPMPVLSSYTASKHAVEGYSDSLRQDLLPWGVTVHIIEPGVFPATGLYGGGTAFKDYVSDSYAKLPKELQQAYGEDFANITGEALGHGLTGVLANKDRSVVSDAMLHALLSPSPKYRYRVGLDCRIMYFVSFLPEWARDAIFALTIKYVFGVDIPPPKEATKAALSRAKGRYYTTTKANMMALAFLMMLCYALCHYFS